MKKALIWFTIFTKRQLKNPVTIILFVLMLTIAVIFAFIPDKKNTDIINAGFHINGNPSYYRELKTDLTSGDSTYNFVYYDDIDSLEKDVKNKTLDCAYIFPEKLTTTLSSQSAGSIKILTLEEMPIQDSVNEYVYSWILKATAKETIQEYFQNQSMDKAQIEELMQLYAKNHPVYNDGFSLFYVEISNYDSANDMIKKDASNQVLFPVRGILSIIIFISTVLGCMTWLQDNEKEIFVTFSRNQRLISKIAYILIPAILLSLIALIILGLTGDFTTFGREISGMLMLTALSLTFSVLLSLILRKSRYFAALAPLLLLGSLIACPVFIKTSSYMPFFKYVEKLFIPYYYLNLF